MIRLISRGANRYVAALSTLALMLSGTANLALARDPEAAGLPVAIAPSDPNIVYEGRFDMSSPDGPRCSWSASMVKLKFTGSALNVRLSDSNTTDRFEIVVDGKPQAVLKIKNGSHLYNVFSAAMSDEHTVALVKRTEPLFGAIEFEGVQLSEDGRLLPIGPRPAHKLEVIGDSISCGYGNDAKDQTEHFNAETENANETYGAIAARELDAEYVCTAWSGRLMWPKNTMDEVYGRTIATDPNSKWDFKAWTPDVVVINLSTNDFYGKVPPASPAWTDGYKAFITRVRGNYPNAVIYCASSPMLDGKKDVADRALLHQVVTEKNDRGDKNVRFLDFKTQNGSDGFGADWHPSIKTHRIMAQVLANQVAQDLGWKVSPGE